MLDKQGSLDREAADLARLQRADARPDKNRIDEAVKLAMENQMTIALKNSERLRRQGVGLKENSEQLETQLRYEKGRVNNMSKAQQKKMRKETEFQIKKQMKFVNEYQMNRARDLNVEKVYLQDLQKQIAEQQEKVELRQEKMNADRDFHQKKREAKLRRAKQSAEDSRKRQSQP
jgi:hypothetical protein